MASRKRKLIFVAEEISSATKISLRFLEAIEREDFSKLPGGIFSRSFIRSYARYLGLDEERVLALARIGARGRASGVELPEAWTRHAALFQIQDGKVTKLVVYVDRDRAFADLGLAAEDAADPPH